MNLRSAHPYWLFHTPQYTYQALNENLKTEIAVIGAGISGALVAYKLVRAGFKVVIITRDHVGTASTAASTSLLQYEIDTPLNELILKVGEETAERSYALCHQSIDELEKIHREIGLRKTFQRKNSLLLASHKKDIAGLEKEFNARRKIGFKVNWLTEEKIKADFGFQSPAGIYSAQGGQTDSYLFTQSLIKWCASHGALVFDKTEVSNIRNNPRSIELITSAQHTITARHAIMATGYEAVKWVDKNIARLHSTYVIISEPFKPKELWKDECLIWETAHPYIYLRTTPDHRIIVGGKDDMFSSPGKRDAIINYKSKQLLRVFHAKFPHLKFMVEYAWAGTFAETRDGLPFIGTIPKFPRLFFSLGYGGNGITFSQIAADIIHDLITKKHNKDADRFGFTRTNYV